jgi:hypothetical protein
MILEPRTAELLVAQLEPLDHRPHSAIEDENSV